MKLIDLSGARFGALTVLDRYGSDSSGKTTWKCNCECGGEVVVTGLNLKSGNTISCGCARHKPSSNRVYLTGRVFGRLTVINPAGSNGLHSLWTCACLCGVNVVVRSQYLLRGVTRSCGCLKLENGAKRWENIPVSSRSRWARRITRGAVCCACGVHKGLHAHHLYPVSLYPESRLDPANGVPLCRECHRQFHAAVPLHLCNPYSLREWIEEKSA